MPLTNTRKGLRKWMVLMAPLTVSAALAGFWSVNSRTPQPAFAEPVLSLSLGYYDQTTTNFFSVDADSEDPSPGAFLVAVPGVGVFWSAEPVDISEEIDGSLTLSFDGDGYPDDEAGIDTAGVFVMDLSGGGSAVEFELSGTISADRSSASITLENDSNTYAVSSSAAPETAADASDDVADLLASEGFAALRLLFVDGFAADVDQASFVDAMDEYFDAFGEVSGAVLDGAVTYELNPGSGPQFAHSTIAVTFGAGPGASTYHMPVLFLYRESAWQVLELGNFAEQRFLMPIGYPGLEIAGEAFDAAPVVALVDGNKRIASDDDSTEVTLAIGDGPAGATLTCTGGLTIEVEDGIATFDGCSVDKPGTYTLVATASGAGSFGFEPFKAVALEGELTADGDSVELTTLVAADSVRFIFESNGSASYSMVIDSEDVASGEFFVRTANSAAIIVAGSIEDGHGYLEFRDASLPAGDYWLVVRGLDGETGTFSGSLYTVTDLSDSISADGNEHTLVATVPGQRARFDFTVGSDKSLAAAVTVSTSGVYGDAALYDGNDNWVWYGSIVDSAGTLFSRPLPAGDYYVVVSLNGGAVGTIGLTPTLISDQIVGGSVATPATAAISISGQNYRLQFSGTASTVIAVDITSSTYTYIDVLLVDPGGTVIGWGYADSSSGHVDGVELPSSGTYEIWVAPQGGTGTATVTPVDETP